MQRARRPLLRGLRTSVPTLAQCIKVAGTTRGWPNNCYYVASRVHAAYFVNKAWLRYGHYCGPTHPESSFHQRCHSMGFCHHAWIETKNGLVVDPTRWVFECLPPYIYSGPGDDDYDPGGNRLIAAVYAERPIPNDGSDQRWFKLAIPDHETNHFVCSLFGKERKDATINLNLAQMFYLANMPIGAFGKFVKPIYKAIAECGHRGLIPLDNRKMADEGSVPRDMPGQEILPCFDEDDE